MPGSQGSHQFSYPDGNWAVEREMPANPSKALNKVKSDVSGRIDGQPVIIEVQASALTIPSIIRRTTNYSQRKCNVLWIVPLTESVGTGLFRPRLYERYFHSMYFGRTYYWVEGYGADVLPVHYGIANRHIECRSWFDSDYKEEMSAGGYNKPYKIVKEPLPGKRVEIGSEFKPRKRGEFIPHNAKKAIPACSVWLDRLEPWWPQQLETRTAADYYR